VDGMGGVGLGVMVVVDKEVRGSPPKPWGVGIGNDHPTPSSRMSSVFLR